MQAVNHRPSGLFITGSDTNVGKTWIAVQLIEQLKAYGIAIKVRKPVESGCTTDNDKQLFPADGNQLFKANGEQETLQLITPLRFSAAVAPDSAARLEGKKIFLAELHRSVFTGTAMDDFLLVEGAGGFYSPIAEDGLNSDLAVQLGLDVVIVVEDRLGAINQGLLVIKAVENEGLAVRAVILNQTKPKNEAELDNLKDLTARTAYPVYYCPFNGRLDTVAEIFAQQS